jgi:rSAM/selenodomain-associated transferase 2
LLAWGDRLEIIVVDGGSQDATVEIVQSLPVGLVTALGGRGAQMNRGAAIAKGEILLFLHSDTQLPQTFITEIEAVLAQPQAIAGAFPLRIDDPRPSLRWIETFVQWRSQYLSLPYGDQAIFLKTSTFQQMGGYAPLPIMEDYELIQRLKKQGKIYLAQHPVITSSRRWRKLGVWRTTWINQLMLLGYHLKLDPQTLKQWYRQQAQ